MSSMHPSVYATKPPCPFPRLLWRRSGGRLWGVKGGAALHHLKGQGATGEEAEAGAGCPDPRH